MADDSPKKKEPTASEALFFFAIVKHTRNKADVDWTAVAEEQGFKNAEVAKVRFGQVKRKLGLTTDPNASPGSNAGSKRGGGGSNAATPTKVTKTGSRRVGTKGKGRGKIKKEEPVDDEDEGIDDESSDLFPRPPPAFKIFKDEEEEEKPAAFD